MADDKPRPQPSLGGDFAAGLIGLLPLALLDPWITAVAGIPVGAALIAARRLLWADRPLGGRIAVALLLPVIAVLLTASFVFRSGGPTLGFALAAALLGVAEGWNRRFGRTLVRRFPLVTAALFLVVGAALGWLMLSAGMVRYPTEEVLKELVAAPDGPGWSPAAREQALGAARRAVLEEVAGEQDVSRLHEQLVAGSPDLAAARSPRGVWVTLYEASGYRSRGHGFRGPDALHDVIRAAAEAAAQNPRKPRSDDRRPRRWHTEQAATRIKIDVPGPAREPTWRPVFHLFEERLRKADGALKDLDPLGLLMSLTYEIEPGVDGIELTRPDDGRVAVMLPDDPVTEGWFTPRIRSGPAKMRSMINRTWRAAFDEALETDLRELGIRKFRATSFGQERAGGPVVDYFRGNALFHGELTRERLVEGIALASDWLARMVKPDGSFHYEIYPPYKQETTDYNLPRHAGSVYGLFAAYRAGLKEPGLRAAGERALFAGVRSMDYIARNLGSPAKVGAPEDVCFLEARSGTTTSGNTALAALAVLEMPAAKDVADPALRETIAGFGADRWIAGMGACMLKMIDPDGKVFRGYAEALLNERVKKEPLYFPGEVMLALVRGYVRTGDETLLEGARRIGDRQVRLHSFNLRFGVPKSGDHWIMQALAELAEATSEHEYARLSFLMGIGSVVEQYPQQEYGFADYYGAYRRVADVPRTTRAASRGEALGGSLRAARLIGKDPSRIVAGLIDGARHLLEQQFVPANSFFVPAGFDVHGAIRMGLVDNHCRIDNNQHAVVGLLAALEAMDLRDGEAR
jgi:hypothetical protein